MKPLKAERRLRELWQRGHEQRHTIEDEALRLARHDIDRRLDGMNELRAQITTERATYVTRDQYDREHGRLREDVDGRLRGLENRLANFEGRMLATGAGVTLVLSLVMIGLHFLK